MAWEADQTRQCEKAPEGILTDLNSLSCVVEQLEKEVAELCKQFDPILKPLLPPPPNKQEGDCPRISTSEVRSQIGSLKIRILAVCEQLNDMKRRMDI